MAQAAEDGAGTLYLHEGPGLCSFALVLEPEEPLATSQLAFLFVHDRAGRRFGRALRARTGRAG